MKKIELRCVPTKIVVEAFLSGPFGGSDSYGGLDGKGPMVVVDLKKQEMVPVPDFEERIQAWRRAGGSNPCPLDKMPTLFDLDSFINHEGAYYDCNKHLIVNGSGVTA